ncbi:zinc finger BED domain-containing protein RICESLEEPER 2-like [Arachis duranensis]|uniref:Zinc finger BED domain-containing protein RICESLEEPER 2-like n=1 Tax=Arachis duranensis TaxID=130453 RepID=A0A6P5N7P8_ARADU|nr:zinc finger BED domain-containing protein RICESLEEPER 2-like [Arachis duranensis]
MNSEIVSNLVTTGVGSEAAPVEIDAPSSKRLRQATSDVWNFFKKLGPDKDGVERAECKGCKKVFKARGKRYDTSTIKRHLDSCTQIKHEDIGQTIAELQLKMGLLKIDSGVARDMFAGYVVAGDKPFNMVDDRRFRNWVKYISPTLKLPSRNMVKADIVKVHKREAAKLKKILVSIPNKICLTSYLWTSSTNEGFICLTAHFVDKNWKLQSKILNFCHMPPPHTGYELSSKIFTLLTEWKVDKNIFSITLDNDSSNDTCVEHLKNIEGLEYTTALCLDVPTRWNSLYAMLASAIPYKKAFEMYKVKEAGFREFCPSSDEWRRTEKICDFLLPFYETTKLMSGTSYPTSNLYFLQVWQIQLILMNSLKNDEVLIRNMGEKMMIKFKKYWEEYSVVLAFGAVLDPRFKLNTLVHCYNEIDPISAKDKVELVKSKLYKLFEVYDHNSSTTVESSSQLSSNFSQATSSAIGTQLIKIVGDLMSRNQEAEVKSGKNQLDIYLSEATLFCNDAIIDVLQWWKDNHHRFPTLSLMARDLLSIPITTVASESAFSMGSHVLNKYRSRLLSDNVEAVICTRNWIRGYDDFEEDKDQEDIAKGEGYSSGVGSNDVIDLHEDEDEN